MGGAGGDRTKLLSKESRPTLIRDGTPRRSESPADAAEAFDERRIGPPPESSNRVHVNTSV